MEAGFPGTKDLDLQFPLHLQELEIGKRTDVGALRLRRSMLCTTTAPDPASGFVSKRKAK